MKEAILGLYILFRYLLGRKYPERFRKNPNGAADPLCFRAVEVSEYEFGKETRTSLLEIVMLKHRSRSLKCWQGGHATKAKQECQEGRVILVSSAFTPSPTLVVD